MIGDVTLREASPRTNWRFVPVPEWVDERTRLYTGASVKVDGREWAQLLTHFDGRATTLYVTNDGFRLDRVGPAVEVATGSIACHRKVVRRWFDVRGIEVTIS